MMRKSIQTIVFVDDDKIQHMINRKNMLRLKPDLALTFFENPLEALDYLAENSEPDLLLLDVNMPEMKGWEFLDRLESLGKKIEVKMLTSSVDPDDLELSSQYAMVSGFLEKPLRQDVISELLGL
jgi:two-component system, response regulator PdtaR